jgi:hypothetical protein
MLAFLTDHHIHLAITTGLRRRGIDVLTASDIGMAEAEDDELLTRATELNRIFVSQDQNLLRIAAEWQRDERSFTGIAFGIQEDLSIGKTIEYLELVAYAIAAEEMRNHVEYIPSNT